MMRGLAATERAVIHVERLILLVGLSVMTLVNLALIFSRQIDALRGVGRYYDLMVNSMPWVAMVGAALAVHYNRHVGMVAFIEQRGPKVRRTALILASAAAIIFFLVLIGGGVSLVRTQLAMGQRTPGMSMPAWWFSLSVPVGGTLALFHFLMRLVSASSSSSTVATGEATAAEPVSAASASSRKADPDA